MTKTKSNPYSFRFGLLIGFTAGLAIGFAALLFCLRTKSPKTNSQPAQLIDIQKVTDKELEKMMSDSMEKAQKLYREYIRATNSQDRKKKGEKAIKYLKVAVFIWKVLEIKKSDYSGIENAFELLNDLDIGTPARPPHFRSPNIIPGQPESP